MLKNTTFESPNSNFWPYVKQAFSANHYQKCILHSNGLDQPNRNIHEKKSSLMIFLNRYSNSIFNEFTLRFLSLFSNYNIMGEAQNQSPFTLLRNFKPLTKIIEGKEDEFNDMRSFFSKINVEIMRSLFLSYLNAKIDRKQVDGAAEDPMFKQLLIRLFLNTLKGDILDYFRVREYIFDVNGDVNLGSDIKDRILEGLDKFTIEIISNVQEPQKICQGFISLMLTQMQNFDKLSDFFSSFVLILALDSLAASQTIEPKRLIKILEEAIRILENHRPLVNEMMEQFNSFVFFFNEFVTKILDGDNNCLFFHNVLPAKSLVYHVKINPVLLGVGFSVFKMKNIKKANEDNVYSENNLPKITIINMDGFDSCENYNILRNFKNIQVISLFLEDEGIGVSEEIEETLRDIEKTRNKKHFIPIPLGSRRIDPRNFKNTVKSKDFLQIFEKIVFPMVANYRPSLLVLSHSFSFCKSTEGQFSLSPKVFSVILYKLGVLANNKMIIVPTIKFFGENREHFDLEEHRKLEEMKKISLSGMSDVFFEDYNKFAVYKQKFQFENLEQINQVRLYIFEMLGALINVMTGNYKKNYIDIKPSNLDYHYIRKSHFFPYLVSLFREKFTRIPGRFSFLKRDIMKFDGKIEKAIQEKTFLSMSEEVEVQSQSLLATSNLRTSWNLKKTMEKNIKGNFDMPSEKEPTCFSNKIALIHPTEERIMYFELFGMDRNKFFYTEQNIICVHYHTKTIFFLNTRTQSEDQNQIPIYQNFMADFDFESLSNSLFVKPMPFYSMNMSQRDCLVDFSLCYSETHLYIIWGRVASIINPDIFSYDIEGRKWTTIYLSTCQLLIPRINAASVVFKVKNQNFLYILGGQSAQTSDPFDIFDQVDFITFKDGDEKAEHQKLPKKTYLNTYKPLLDSQLFPLSISQTKTPNVFEALMIGGSYSRFLHNQEKKPLTFYHIAFHKPDSIYSVVFDGFMKHQQDFLKKNAEGLNLLFASQSKNYYFHQIQKKIVLVVDFFSNEAKGIFLPYNKTETSAGQEATLQQTGDSEYEGLTRLQIGRLKQEFQPLRQKLIYSNISLSHPIKAPYFTLGKKTQERPIFEATKIDHLKNFFEPDSNYRCILIDEGGGTEFIIMSARPKQKNDGLNKEEFTFQRLGFYTNDLKKENYNYFEYIPTRLKSNNYALKGHTLYILINNEKDTNGKRIIYSINIKTIDKDARTRIELNKVYEDKLNILKGGSIVADPQFLYVVGGEVSDLQKFGDSEFEGNQEFIQKINFSFEMQKNAFATRFARNLNEMNNPFVVSSGENLFCFNRKIITNPYLELEFFQIPNEKTLQDLKALNVLNSHCLYGETIRTKSIEYEEWHCFLIDLINGELIFPFNKQKNLDKKQKNMPNHISLDLLPIGRIANPEGMAFLYTYKNENTKIRRKRKLVFIDFEELREVLYNGKESKGSAIVKIKNLERNWDGFWQNEILVRLNDSTQNKESKDGEEEIYTYSQNLQKICLDPEFEQMK